MADGHQYIVFYKPYGMLSQFTAEPGSRHRTLSDAIPLPGVYVAGRLDADSEGLLVLTDDGRMQHLLTDPRYAHPRTYWVQVEGVPDEDTLRALAAGGVEIRGHRTLPAKARMLASEPDLPPRNPPVRFRKNIPTSWLELTLTEGKNRQVRRMTAAVGFPTLRLVRVAIGPLRLEGLEPGEWRRIPPKLLESLIAPAATEAAHLAPPLQTQGPRSIMLNNSAGKISPWRGRRTTKTRGAKNK